MLHVTYKTRVVRKILRILKLDWVKIKPDCIKIKTEALKAMQMATI